MYALFAQDLMGSRPRYLVSRFATVAYAKRKAHNLAGHHLNWNDGPGPVWAYDLTYQGCVRVHDVTYAIIKEEVS